LGHNNCAPAACMCLSDSTACLGVLLDVQREETCMPTAKNSRRHEDSVNSMSFCN
jgi:hypothetical protein